MKQEDFDGWLTDPVTKWVFRALERAAEQEKAEWVRQSWEAGKTDPLMLAELRAKAEAFDDLRHNDFETWQGWNDD